MNFPNKKYLQQLWVYGDPWTYFRKPKMEEVMTERCQMNRSCDQKIYSEEIERVGNIIRNN